MGRLEELSGEMTTSSESVRARLKEATLAPGKGGSRIGSETVCLRWLRIDAPDPADLAVLRTLLDDREQKSARRFRREEDQFAYVVGHALVRISLAQFAGRSPHDWRFSIGRHGKPEPLRQADEPDIRFSMSHADGVAAVSLTTDNDIGVDVEHLEASRFIHDVRPALASAEQAYLSQLPSADAAMAFCRIWTIKEAFLKAVGAGLARPLDSFAVGLDPEKIGDPDDPTATWFVQSVPLGDTHLASVALRQSAPGRVALSIDEMNVESLVLLTKTRFS